MESLGGDLRSAEQILMLTRVIARRDMNVAVSESTQVWMMLAWIGGDAEQQAKYAATMLRGGGVPCLAYSEPGHGADLAANDFVATPDSGQYVLSGEKWPINRGRTSTHVVLLGTTGDDDVPAKRRQSMFLVDRKQVISGTVTGVPRVPTYGLRGCDISGVAFEEFGAEVTADAGLGTRVKDILDDLMREHDALRIGFRPGEDGPTQWVQESVPLDVRHTDARDVDPQTLRDRIRHDTRIPFDLSRPPLWRIHLYRTAETTGSSRS